MSDTSRPQGVDRLALIVVMVGLGVSLALYAVARRLDGAQQQEAFRTRAASLTAAIEREVVPSIEYVSALASFFVSSEDVSREEFRTFTLPALRRNPALAALEWVPRVPAAEREAFETAQRDAVPHFEVREPDGKGGMKRSPSRSFHYPIQYMEPPAEQVLGMDIGFDEGRNEALQQALVEDALFISKRFRLVEDAPGVYSVAAYAPVRKGPSGELAGIAVGLFRLEPLLDQSIAVQAMKDAGVVLTDDGIEGEERFLFSSFDDPPAALGGDHTSVSTPMKVGGRTWSVHVVSREPLHSSLPLVLLLASLGITVAAGVGTIVARRLQTLQKEVATARRLGQYRLTRKLGEGGMGEVYKARHAMLRRPTAIKVIRGQRDDHQSTARFEREVQAAAELTHPNAITVFDFGRTPEGALYYAMEYVEGIDLQELVDREGPLPEGRVVRFLAQASGALGDAHRRGLIHRDVKPSNIMICRQGGIDDFIKVVDFGLVKMTEPLDGEANLSQDVDMIGTPYYMAPEQMLDPSNVGPRADVYALGAVAYFLVTGKELFEAQNMAQLVSKCLTSTPEPPSKRGATELSPAFEALILRCIGRDVDERPGDGFEFRSELLDLVGVQGWTDDEAHAWWERVGEEWLEERRMTTLTIKRQVLAVDVAKRRAGSTKTSGALPDDV